MSRKISFQVVKSHLFPFFVQLPPLQSVGTPVGFKSRTFVSLSLIPPLLPIFKILVHYILSSDGPEHSVGWLPFAVSPIFLIPPPGLSDS